MPTPLTARSPGAAPFGEQVAIVTAFGIPLAGLWYCWDKHRPVHFDDPWLNLGAHVCLILFPLLWVGLFNRSPVIYESSDADVDLGRSTFLGCLPVSWWGMFIMWATPVFCAAAFVQALSTRYLPDPQALSTPPGRALLIMAVLFCLGTFYSTILLGRSEPTTRVSDEGLRTGVLRFYRWEDIHHISRQGRLHAVYHRVNPALPATSFRLPTPQAQLVFDAYLSRHQVQISNQSAPAYFVVRLAVVLAFAANLLADYWLRFNTALSLTSIALISFGIGIALTVVLEKYRGVSKYGKYKPIVKLDEMVAPGGDILTRG